MKASTFSERGLIGDTDGIVVINEELVTELAARLTW
jgi:regulator of RNase E activity RraA